VSSTLSSWNCRFCWPSALGSRAMTSRAYDSNGEVSGLRVLSWSSGHLVVLDEFGGPFGPVLASPGRFPRPGCDPPHLPDMKINTHWSALPSQLAHSPSSAYGSSTRFSLIWRARMRISAVIRSTSDLSAT
jgi:hypothetical protein